MLCAIDDELLLGIRGVFAALEKQPEVLGVLDVGDARTGTVSEGQGLLGAAVKNSAFAALAFGLRSNLFSQVFRVE